MRTLATLATLACLSLVPPTASAQLRVVHDTLSADTPTAITCGFCAGEQFGVIFRELPGGRRGLRPSDFPLQIDAVEIGMGAATVEASACVPQSSGGTILASVAILVGDAPPTGSIRGLSEAAEWSATERLVWGADEVPLTLSVQDAAGRYALMFNRLEIQDDMMRAITVDSGAYLRVVVSLPEGAPGTSDICTDPLVPPGGFPVRDDDGRIADERNFIFATGAGWFWNEEVPGGAINGDWGIRLSVFPSGVAPTDDAGLAEDAGSSPADASAADVDAGDEAPDAGGAAPAGGGCGCRASGGERDLGWILGLWVVVALRRWR